MPRNGTRQDATKVKQGQSTDPLPSRLHRDALSAGIPISPGFPASDPLSVSAIVSETARAASSAVERFVYTEDVGGSIPSPPTTRRSAGPLAFMPNRAEAGKADPLGERGSTTTGCAVAVAACKIGEK
jgi:hypothetical protein